MVYLLTAIKAGTRFRNSYTQVGQQYTATDAETIELIENGAIQSVNDGGSIYTPQNVLPDPTFSTAVYIGGTNGGGDGTMDPIQSVNLAYATGTLTTVVSNSGTKSGNVKVNGSNIPIEDGNAQTVKQYVDNKIPPSGNYVPVDGEDSDEKSKITNSGTLSIVVENKSSSTNKTGLSMTSNSVVLSHKTNNDIALGDNLTQVNSATIGVAGDKAYYNGQEFFSKGNLKAGANVNFSTDSTTGATLINATGGGEGGNDPITTNSITITDSKLKSTVGNSSTVSSNELLLSGTNLQISTTDTTKIKDYIDANSGGGGTSYAYDATRSWRYMLKTALPTTPSFIITVDTPANLTLMNGVNTVLTIPRSGDFIEVIDSSGEAVFAVIISADGEALNCISLSQYAAIEQQTLFFGAEFPITLISNDVMLDIGNKTVSAGTSQKLILQTSQTILPGESLGTFQPAIKTQADNVLEMLIVASAHTQMLRFTTADYQNVKLLNGGDNRPIPAGSLIEIVVKKSFEVK
jgi:hypothetical protein